jgi:endonuclease/exonuclease/phosphatase family metal-dependent hydrolase
MVSRAPVLNWHALSLPAAPVRSPVYVPTARRFILLRDEPRVALAAELTGPCGPLIVATTHLSFVPGWNARQLRRVVRWLASLGSPCVLLGDMNLPGALPRWVSGSRWRTLARVRTFPAANPSMQIDHALGFGELPDVVGVAARRLPLSDHRALVVDLEK